MCYLKNAEGSYPPDANVISAYRTSTAGSAPTCPSADGTVYKDANGVNYAIRCGQDNDVLSYTGIYIPSGGFAACFARCDADSACGGFSFVGGDSGTCYLRNREGNYTPNPAVVSVYKRVDPPAGGDGLSTATGVIATVNGVDTHIKLTTGGKGRVIVSGGALMSPQILMWSGIGDRDTLTTLQSSGLLDPAMTPDKWVVNNGVGAGLFDNPNTFIELRSSEVQAYKYNYSDVNPTDAGLYVNSRAGPYAFAGQLAVFWDSVTHPDGSVAGFQGTVGAAGYQDYTDEHTITLNVYGTSGLKSKGKVVLDVNGTAGSSPETYYSDPQDALDIAGFIRRLFDALQAGGGFTPLNMDANWSVEQIATYITTCKFYFFSSESSSQYKVNWPDG